MYGTYGHSWATHGLGCLDVVVCRMQVYEMVKLVKEYRPAAEEAVHNLKMAAKTATMAQQAAPGPSAPQAAPQPRAARAGDSAALPLPTVKNVCTMPGASTCKKPTQ